MSNNTIEVEASVQIVDVIVEEQLSVIEIDEEKEVVEIVDVN